GQKDTVRILSDLQAAYPSSEPLQQALGEANERVIRRAHQALTAGEAEALGTWMTEAQRIFDQQVAPHSPEQLASPLLHEVLHMPALQPHVYGGKGVGSQGDGTAQLVARSEEDRDAAAGKIIDAYPRMRCFPLTIGTANP
ncbi:MAG: GHMP kinase, partial [Planctomycetota bacterium]